MVHGRAFMIPAKNPKSYAFSMLLGCMLAVTARCGGGQGIVRSAPTPAKQTNLRALVLPVVVSSPDNATTLVGAPEVKFSSYASTGLNLAMQTIPGYSVFPLPPQFFEAIYPKTESASKAIMIDVEKILLDANAQPGSVPMTEAQRKQVADLASARLAEADKIKIDAGPAFAIAKNVLGIEIGGGVRQLLQQFDAVILCKIEVTKTIIPNTYESTVSILVLNPKDMKPLLFVQNSGPPGASARADASGALIGASVAQILDGAKTTTTASAQTEAADGSGNKGRCRRGDCWYGLGYYVYENGDIFSGEWFQKKPDFGKLYLSNGCIYEGHFKNNDADGFGDMLCPDIGLRIIGEFKAGIAAENSRILRDKPGSANPKLTANQVIKARVRAGQVRD
ncbi:MAG: hypothetical protein ACOY5B_08350 [Spirochaetota bacterium]